MAHQREFEVNPVFTLTDGIKSLWWVIQYDGVDLIWYRSLNKADEICEQLNEGIRC